MPLFYWSGLSNVSDLSAATRNGIAAGVVASDLSANARKLAALHLQAGHDLFVDSGAFGAFMSERKAAELANVIGRGFLVPSSP